MASKATDSGKTKKKAKSKKNDATPDDSGERAEVAATEKKGNDVSSTTDEASEKVTAKESKGNDTNNTTDEVSEKGKKKRKGKASDKSDKDEEKVKKKKDKGKKPADIAQTEETEKSASKDQSHQQTEGQTPIANDGSQKEKVETSPEGKEKKSKRKSKKKETVATDIAPDDATKDEGQSKVDEINKDEKIEEETKEIEAHTKSKSKGDGNQKDKKIEGETKEVEAHTKSKSKGDGNQKDKKIEGETKEVEAHTKSKSKGDGNQKDKKIEGETKEVKSNTKSKSKSDENKKDEKIEGETKEVKDTKSKSKVDEKKKDRKIEGETKELKSKSKGKGKQDAGNLDDKASGKASPKTEAEDKPIELTEEECDKLLALADVFFNLKTSTFDHMQKLSEFEEVLLSVEDGVDKMAKVHSGTCQLLWRIPDFGEKYGDAKNGTRPVLHSPSFETHLYGYNLALSLCPYGDGVGKGKYMSLFFCLLRSEYDSLLSWPFTHPLEFTVVDQSDDADKKHISSVFVPNPAKENLIFLGKPVDVRNPSLGLPRFVCLSDLWEGDRYIKDNTLFLKVNIEMDDVLPI